jgi:hypothetical protein
MHGIFVVERIAALFRDHSRAFAASRALERAGLSGIRVIEASQVHGLTPRVRSAAPEGVVLGAIFGATGGAITALVAFIVPEALFGIDGLLHVMRAGALAGGVVGLQAGLAIGLGTPEPQARRYAKAALADGLLVSVDVADEREARLVKKFFGASRAIELESPAERPRFRRPIGARPVTS